MGAFSSTEAGEMPDLTIEVDLSEGAKAPTFGSTGRGGLTLYASEDVTLEPNKKTKVPTGVTPRLPFMLIGMVVGERAHQIDIATQIVDCDTSTPIDVEVTFRPHDLKDEPRLAYKQGDPVALLVILPIARPGLRASRPARNDDEAVTDPVVDLP